VAARGASDGAATSTAVVAPARGAASVPSEGASTRNVTTPATIAAGRAIRAARRAARRVTGSTIYRWTTEQVSVRVMPGTSWTLLTIILPSSSTLRASVNTTTSYGPVTASTRTTPPISR